MFGKQKLTLTQKIDIIRSHQKGVSAKSLAGEYGVSSREIYSTLRSDKERKKDSDIPTQQISVKLTQEELATFDEIIKRHGYGSRAHALRRLIQIADRIFVSDKDM